MTEIQETSKINNLIDLLSNIFGNMYGVNELEPSFHYPVTGQIGFDCPICSDLKGEPEGDGKANFEINYYKGVYKCWSCHESHNTSGTVRQLIKRFGDSRHLKTYDLLNFDFNYDANHHLFDFWGDDDIELELPSDFTPIFELENPQRDRVLNYLKGKRKLTDDIILKYNIGYCSEGWFEDKRKFTDMAIIPSYNRDGELNYFVGRRIGEELYPKYMLIPNRIISKRSIVFNEYFVNWNKTVFLVEGVMDHISIPNSIPLLGKYLSEKLWRVIYENANNYVIIMLDGTAMDDSKKIYERLNGGRLLNKVLINDLGDDDPGSFYEKYGMEGWKDQIKNNSFRI